jgi:excisionase family DNA binding protein
VITLDDIRQRPTISVPEAGELLGIGKNAAYRAADQGQIPVLHLGRTLRVPVPKLLELLGDSASAEPATGPAPASTSPASRGSATDDDDPQHRHPSNVVRIDGR